MSSSHDFVVHRPLPLPLILAGMSKEQLFVSVLPDRLILYVAVLFPHSFLPFFRLHSHEEEERERERERCLLPWYSVEFKEPVIPSESSVRRESEVTAGNGLAPHCALL